MTTTTHTHRYFRIKRKWIYSFVKGLNTCTIFQNGANYSLGVGPFLQLFKSPSLFNLLSYLIPKGQKEETKRSIFLIQLHLHFLLTLVEENKGEKWWVPLLSLLPPIYLFFIFLFAYIETTYVCIYLSSS